MKFYLALVGDRRVWGKRKDEAAKLDKHFQTLDVDISQDALIERFQAYEDRIAELDRAVMAQKVAELGPDRDEVLAEHGIVDESHIRGDFEEVLGPPREVGEHHAKLVQLAELQDQPRFDPALLESQVELLGQLGEEGFDQLEHRQENTGVGAAFSRGVHILSIVASGEHQLARMLFRSRKERKWGTR
jgi:hypothetical protein